MSEPFIGEIRMFTGDYAPRGWTLCDGRTLQVSEFSALFSVLGTRYGGNGQTTFAVPDLRCRVPVNFGSAPGLSTYQLGQKGGAERVTLSAQQAPAHTHSVQVNAVSGAGNQSAPGGHVWAADARGTTQTYSDAAPDTTMSANAAVAAQNTGGGQAHENRPPFLAVNFIIALEGAYPSRN